MVSLPWPLVEAGSSIGYVSRLRYEVALSQWLADQMRVVVPVVGVDPQTYYTIAFTQCFIQEGYVAVLPNQSAYRLAYR